MSFSNYPPPAPLPAPATRKPGKAGIIIAIALIVLGPVIGTILIVVSTLSATSAISGAAPYAADDSPVPIELTGGAEMGLWVYDAQVDRCQIADPTGAVVPLNGPGSTSSSLNGYSLVATFTPPSSGTYVVACATPSASTFKIAPRIQAGGMVAGIVAGVLLIVVLLFGGLALLIVTVVRRSSWNSRYGPGAQAVAPAYPYPDQPTPGPTPSYAPPVWPVVPPADPAQRPPTA